ncbi:hypothetical protein GGI21_002737 [Coemansia aciculifera]|nr:hypothetical protein GGI21_002737 [Coemansia aciculifera]
MHRLRSRTHSNSINVPGAGGGEQTTGAERARKRSDAEVKSRDSSASPPLLPQHSALPDHLQRIPAAGRRVAGAKHAKLNGVSSNARQASLQPPPSSSSSSSGTQGDVFRTPQNLEAPKSHRRSHDGGMSAADSARQHNHHHQSSTVRVARGQNDVATKAFNHVLRPANGDVETAAANGEQFGTRSSRSRRNTSESASSAPPHAQQQQPLPPRKFTLNVGRGGSERPTSAHDDSDDAVLDPPPVPRLPAGSPPLPPISAIISPQEAAKTLALLADRRQHPAGDVDSIDYHLRRLRPANNSKSRRSSFMTTISNMLAGRKE